jgi:hypothetical protein
LTLACFATYLAIERLREVAMAGCLDINPPAAESARQRCRTLNLQFSSSATAPRLLLASRGL